MTSRDCYRSLIQLVITSTVVTSHWIEFDEQDVFIAYLKGMRDLIDGSRLFFAQYVRLEGPGREQISREKYRYHWQAPVERLVIAGITRVTIQNWVPFRTIFILGRAKRRRRAAR